MCCHKSLVSFVLRHFVLFVSILAVGLVQFPALAQPSLAGTVHGVVTIEDTGKPVHGVSVTLLQLKRSIITGEDGSYEFQNVPPGTYDLVAHLDRVPDVVKSIQVTEQTMVEVPIQLRLQAKGIRITVTATGSEETALKSIQPVISLLSTELAEKNSQSLGEALDHELGIAKRSFGPGTSRPVVRGFDGDRVLVLEDGNRTGALGFQSGDHAEPIDVLTLEKLEVVKGPATLLYGSSAIGGVVNAITGHESAHPGIHGYITGIAGTNNSLAGGSGRIEYGARNWLFSGSGGGQRAGDYDTPGGKIMNSFTRGGNADGTVGYYSGRGFLSLNYAFDKRRYGIPFDPAVDEAEVVFLNPRHHSVRLNAGLRDMDASITGVQVSLQYNDYRHQETNSFTGEANTVFKNKAFNYRAVLDQRKKGRWSGSFGFWGLYRDYASSGEEAISPPTVQNAFALFGLQKIDFKHVSFQAGGRYEHNEYAPLRMPDRPTLQRSFDGFSGSAGLSISLWKGGAFAANYSHSFRAPSLEELYNNGPHAGNATFEIGNPNLKRERSDGIDLSIRHSLGRLKAEANYFHYYISDFIFLAPTGRIEDGLIEANYAQGTSRYKGVEGKLEVALRRGLWVLSKMDYINAKLADTHDPLPRIPPLRGIVGVEATFRGFRFYPEVVLSRDQNRIFPTETRTPGYAVFNFTASYTIARQHGAHTLSLDAFNLGGRLYRNHLSFIKEFAPEIGRGIRFAYTLRFY